MIATREHIEAAFRWDAGTIVETRKGTRLKRTAPVTEEAKAFWTRHRADCATVGVTYGEWPKGSGKWTFTWWDNPPADYTEKRREAVIASRATDAEVDLVAPPGLSYFGYQRAGIRYILNSQHGVLLGDEMGLGKTIQIIGYINNEPKCSRVLIVCPAGLLLNWAAELNVWMTRRLSVAIVDGKTFPTSDIVLCPYSMLTKWAHRINTTHWDLVAADEAHYMKNPKAQRTRALLGYRPKKNEDASLASAPTPARKRIFATGTPICNRPEELWPLVSTLNPVEFNSWWKFHTRYCGFSPGSWGKPQPSNLDELQEKLRASVMIRRLKADVLKDLPPKVRQVVLLDPDPSVVAEERRLLREVCEGHGVEAPGNTIEWAKALDSVGEGNVKFPFTEISRIRHMTALAKVPMAVDFIRELMEEKDKVIVFAHHQDVIAKLIEGLGGADGPLGILKIDGSMSKEAKREAVVKFQNDPRHKLVIASILAAGVGITLTAADTEVFVEFDWVPGNVTQAEDRAHRIGQTDMVHVMHLVMEGTIDSKMIRTIIRKQEIADAATTTISEREEKMIAGEKPTEVKGITPLIDYNATEHPVRKPQPPTSRELLRAEGLAMSEEEIEAVHSCLKILAGSCDGARRIDGAGFSRLDSRTGRELAFTPYLSRSQAAFGRRIIRKYKRQLPEGDYTLAVGAAETHEEEVA